MRVGVCVSVPVCACVCLACLRHTVHTADYLTSVCVASWLLIVQTDEGTSGSKGQPPDCLIGFVKD